MSGGIEFRILGPFDITREGEPVRVAAAKHRVLLARLLADANRVVPVDRLIECLWDSAPPATARAVVHTYVSRLRQALGSVELIETLPNGYRVNVRNDQLDLLRFRELVRLSRQARDPAAESALLREAGALWRGPALETVPSDALRREAAQLDNEELAAADRRVELDLALGRHHDLVPELRAMVARRPFSERLRGQLMLALHRCGRQAEALSSYQEFRGELGSEPGSELRELHQAILRGEDEPPAPSTSDWTPVSQLPPHVGDFVGRADELSTISALLKHRGSLTAPLVVLSGPPGVGKTALAVHAAHNLKDDFPDGQLYVNLRGYSPEPALTAAQVLPQFLRALGVPPEQVPLTEEEQAERYRALLSGRRVLVVLDNASAPEQVRALAPSSATCATVVTSRNNLSELIALNGAQPLAVDVLGRESALLLLERIIGTVAAAPDAANTLVDLCGALPLALRIAAANIAFDDERDIQSYVDDLSGDRFSALAIDGDREAAVQAAFDLSYEALPQEAQRIFRLLSLIPGADFTAHAAAALGEIAVDTAERILQQLATVNLLQSLQPGRYQFHDLIRAYASALSSSRDTAEAPFTRLLDYYSSTAYRAAVLLYPDALTITGEEFNQTPIRFDDSAAAKQWLDSEHENVLSAANKAIETCRHYHLWRFADALRGYLQGSYLNDQLSMLIDIGLAAAKEQGHTEAAASMLHTRGNSFLIRGRYTECIEHYERAAHFYRENNHTRGLAGSVSNLGIAYQNLGDIERAISAFEESLAIAKKHSDPHGESRAVNNLSIGYTDTGDLPRALELSRRSLELSRQLEIPSLEVAAQGNISFILFLIGQVHESAKNSNLVISIAQESGAQHAEIISHVNLGDCYCTLNQTEQAISHASTALERAIEVGDDWIRASALSTLGEAYLKAGRRDDGFHYLTAAVEHSERLSYTTQLIAPLYNLASFWRDSGELTRAKELADKARTLSRTSRYTLADPEVYSTLALLALDTGDVAGAREHVTTAADASQRMGRRLARAHAHHVSGLIAQAAGDNDKALAEWGEARSIFTALNVPGAEDMARLIAENG